MTVTQDTGDTEKQHAQRLPVLGKVARCIQRSEHDTHVTRSQHGACNVLSMHRAYAVQGSC